MATWNQQSHPSGQVVSVRLPPDIVKRIDALAEHTGRSRGLYIRLALSAFLPQLEEDHWNQKTARYERDGFDRDFAQLTTHLMKDPEPIP
ncbi:RHH-type rel operon transcriptional repressor/antitoxin RelB [Arthrobacter sp. CAN_A6]|uniref:ribbon-helix-helix protein, CopG family n=1 Tax=Arthrobacter sp. CAN_A6 TaxID=2787721 RepID=UPI0018CB7945